MTKNNNKESLTEEENKIQDLMTENENLKRMELSEEVREALKKIQRFDRILYLQESDKICREALMKEIKRLEKIKNSHKEMRLIFFDN